MSVLRDDEDWISPEKYFENGTDERGFRHEYLAGQIYAMAGASVEHNLIAGDLFAALHARIFPRKPCRTSFRERHEGACGIARR